MNAANRLVSAANGRIRPGPLFRDGFEVIVVFTRMRSTLRALKTAASLANELGARIRLLVPHIVPYPVPLEERLAGTAFLERRFRTIVGGRKVETRVDIRLCRTRWRMLQRVLAAGSVVVLGGRRRWWTTAESRLTRKLQAAGHHVVFLQVED